MLREGHYEVHANAAGYERFTAPLTIGEARNQTYTFALTPLPGRIDFGAQPAEAEVFVDGVSIGTTPLKAVEVAAGERKVAFRNARYLPQEMTVTHRRQTRSAGFFGDARAELGHGHHGDIGCPPARRFSSTTRRSVHTPAAFEVVAGVHELRLKHPGFKTWRDAARSDGRTGSDTAGRFKLEAADGLVTIASKPAGAGVTVNGTYRGETPLELALTPGTRYDIRITRAGFETAQRQVQLQPERRTVDAGRTRAADRTGVDSGRAQRPPKSSSTACRAAPAARR